MFEQVIKETQKFSVYLLFAIIWALESNISSEVKKNELCLSIGLGLNIGILPVVNC